MINAPRDPWKVELSSTGRIVLRGSSGAFKRPGEKLVGEILDTFGAIPESESDKLALVNQKSKMSLSGDQVYLHTVEAISSVFLPDRWAFFSGNTIKNAAMDADAGVAFLNGHRHDLLPLGRTFAGSYEQTLDQGGKLRERCLMGIYLPKGYEPNGDDEPSSDDIDLGVQFGTIFDVSVGLLRGPEGILRCNVCNQPYWGSSCRHYRGSNDGMTLDEQIYARDVLGVPGGVCTVSFENWHVNEVSAVYDGAVAGAGYL
jgi:hypothetical protein